MYVRNLKQHTQFRKFRQNVWVSIRFTKSIQLRSYKGLDFLVSAMQSTKKFVNGFLVPWQVSQEFSEGQTVQYVYKKEQKGKEQ